MQSESFEVKLVWFDLHFAVTNLLYNKIFVFVIKYACILFLDCDKRNW